MSDESKLLITNAGLAEIRNAEASGTAPVVLSHIAFGTGKYTATADKTALTAEFKRFDAVAGGAIGDNVIHLTIHDNSTGAYTVNEVGVFTESGTLFAVYSQSTPIVQKAADAEVMLAIDIVLTDIDPESITVGDTNFVLNPATTEKQGTVELATNAEAIAGTDATRAITPATLKAKVDNYDAGVVHKATTETITGQKTFENNPVVKGISPTVFIKQTDVERGVVPSSTQSSGLTFTDINGKTLGQMQQVMDTATSKIQFTVNKPSADSSDNAYLSLIYPTSGDPYATAPTPATNDNSTKIATTACVEGKLKNYLPLAGGQMTGNISFTDGQVIAPTVSAAYRGIGLYADNGVWEGNGAGLALRSKNSENNAAGIFQLRAGNGTDTAVLLGKPNGSLTWNGKNITLEGDCLPLTGGTLTGTVFTTADGAPVLSAKKGSLNGGRVFLFSPDNDTYSGGVVLRAYSSDNSVYSDFTLKADGTSTWNGKNIVRSINNTTADANGNVAITSVASATKATQDGNGKVIADTYLPRAGGSMTSQYALMRDVSNSYLGLYGGTAEKDGAQLDLCGSEHATMPSVFQLHARNADTDKILRGEVSGDLTWDGKKVLTNSFLMPSDSGAINLTAGTSSAGGAYFRLYGKDNSSGAGQFVLAATNGTNTKALTGKPDGTLTWDGKDVITSAGDQTIAGVKTFTNQINRTVAFSGDSARAISINDSNNKGKTSIIPYYTNATVYNRLLTENTTSGKQAYLDVQVTDTGDALLDFRGSGTNKTVGFNNVSQVLVPTPTSATDNSTKAATTAWTHSYLSAICSGTYRTKTLLFNGPIDTGNITLSQPYTDFDALLVGYSDDSANYVGYSIVPKYFIKTAKSHNKSWMLIDGFYYWICANTSTTSSFVHTHNNCRIVHIYGINF